MSLKGEDALILAQDYVDETLKGAGALKGQDGKDGVSPVISVNTSTADTYKLDITDKNGTITTPNLVGKQGLQGIQGEQGKPADNPIVTENAENTEDVYKLDLTVGETVFTTRNIQGKQGLEGVSPSVTTNPDNTAEDYRLNITTKGGTFTTPNLRGPQGEIGPQGESAASAINPRGDYDVNAEPSYTKSDYITYTDGNTYVCKLDNPTNEPPIDGTVTDTYWQVIAFRGAQGIAGKDGEKGADGVTFTPSIDENGVLSFTNNGGLENPEPIDIKGDNGITFTPSIDTDGYLSFTNNGNLENPEPIKVLGKDGVDGKDGADGTTYIPSIGTVTTVESNADASAGVTVDEETKEAVFNFAIPKGQNGEDGKDAEQRIYTTLAELGLTAPVTVGDIFNAMEDKTIAMIACEDITDHITDVPMSYGVLTIKKGGIGRFSIDYQNSLFGSPCNVKRWIGTLKGSDGTGLTWKQLSAEPTFVTLSDIGLTADATIQDVRDALPIGSTALLRTDEFTNWSTLFNGIKHGYFKVEKTINGLSNMELQEVIKPSRRYLGTQPGGKFTEWQQVASGITDVLTNNSNINQVPNAKLMTMEIYGRSFTIDDYSDALTMPAGKWRVDTNNKASKMQNLPVSRAGILEVRYLDGNDGTTAYTGTRKYAMLTYTNIDGNIYKRSFNSDDTVGNIVNDTGWQEIATKDYIDSKIADLQAQINALK